MRAGNLGEHVNVTFLIVKVPSTLSHVQIHFVDAAFLAHPYEIKNNSARFEFAQTAVRPNCSKMGMMRRDASRYGSSDTFVSLNIGNKYFVIHDVSVD